MSSDYEDFSLPEELDFCIPGESSLHTLQFDDDVKLHRQLVCWCLIQRFWYYVVGEPKVEDGLYDAIEREIKSYEESADYLRKNPYSPSKHIGSSRPTDYPYSIQLLFYLGGVVISENKIKNNSPTPLTSI